MKFVHEARSVTRERTYLRARITYNNGFTTVNCLVRNFSRQGANLVLPGNDPLPREFELHMPVKKASYLVAVVWRKEDTLGVEFIRSVPSRGFEPTYTDPKPVGL